MLLRPKNLGVKRITKRRPRESFIFVKSDGERWKRSEQTRLMKAAIKKAELDDRGGLYALRHAYISEAKGSDGLCINYIKGIAEKLSALGISDPAVVEMWQAVRAIT